MNIWEHFSIEEKKCYLRQVGPLKIWIQHKNDEWLIASERIPEDYEIVNSGVLSEEPLNADWSRYVLSGTSKRVDLSPAMSERPVIVRPESLVKIESGAEALFFLLLPVWIKVTVGSRKQHFLTEYQTKVLSNTWFGEPHDGELCYYLKTWAKRSLDGLTPRPHQAVCPVFIKNSSANDLDFNRLCIRTGFLSVYKGTSWLWTNKVHVQFRGINQTSRIKYGTEAPDFEPSSRLIGLPRQKPAKEFSIKSFDTFKVSLLG